MSNRLPATTRVRGKGEASQSFSSSCSVFDRRWFHRRLHLGNGKSAKTQPMKSRTRTSTSTIGRMRGNPGLADRLLSRIGKELGVFLFELVKEPLSDRVER